MYKSPKITVVKKSDLPAGPSLAISGKNIFKDKLDMFAHNSSNVNEFTFSPKNIPEGVEFKKAPPKNPFEKNLVQSTKDAHEYISKNEMFEKLGIRNPEAEQVADLAAPSMTMGVGTMPKNKKDATNNLISNLQTEIEKLKYKRDTYIENKEKEKRKLLEKERMRRSRGFEEEEEAQIVLHKDEGRIQRLEHPISSLEKPTLENVEALLRAHREKMQNIEREYLEKKKHMILTSEDNFESNVVRPLSTRAAVDGESIKLGKENRTTYERPKSSKYTYKKEPYKKHKEPEVIRLKKKKEEERNYKKKFEEYLYEKRDMVEQGIPLSPPKKKDFDLFAPTSPNPKRAKSKNKWDSGNVVENEKKSTSPHRDSHVSPREETLKYSTNKSERSFQDHHHHYNTSPPRSHKKAKLRQSSPGRKHKKDTEESELAENEVKLLHWVFNIIKKNNDDIVDKEDICDYVLKSPQILELYDIDPVNLRTELYAFPTDTRDAMYFEEFLGFLQNSRNRAEGRVTTTQEDRQSIKSTTKKSGVRFSKSPRKGPKPDNVCVLSEEAMETIKEVFHEVDKYEDLIVRRQALLKRLREDVRIARILHKPAVHIVEIDKYLSLERLLRQIEEEETSAVADQKKSKEYVSLNQFLRYFTNYETPDDLAEKMGEKIVSPKKSPRSMRAIEEDDQDVVEIAPRHMKFFRDVFDSLPKKRHSYVETIQLIDAIRGHENYKVCRWEPGRRKAMRFTLPNETVEEVLNRMENEAEKYISWEDFAQFFTRRGKPRRLLTTTYNIEQDMIQSGLASDPKDKALQTGAKVVQNLQRDGYDSDPEFHTYSKDINYEFKLNRSVHNEIREELSKIYSISVRNLPLLGSSKEVSPLRSRGGDMSPGRHHHKDQMVQIRLGTDQGSPKGRSPTRSAKDHTSPRRNRADSPKHNRSASFDRERMDTDEEYRHASRGRKREALPFAKSMDPKFGAIYQDPSDLKYTVPQPFEFDTREKVRAKSIRERKVEEMIIERQMEEERMLNHRFRAKSVPGIVKTPLFEQIIHDQEHRRAQVKKNSVAITKMREAPFSFYARDKSKPPKPSEPSLNPEFNKRFKAKPIPAICQLTDVWKNMKEREEIERKERVARLAQQNLLLASLPPRMAKHEKEKKEQELRSQINERNMEKQKDRKPFIANEVPDFERIHKQFQEHLDRKRRNKRPTEPKPFMFQESKKGVARDYLDIENQYKKAAKDEMKRDPFESVRKLKETKPKVQPHTTKKMISLMDLRKQEREDKQRRMEQLEKEEEERKERYKKMKPLVQGSAAIVDRTVEKEEKAKQVKEEVKKKMIQDQKNFEEKKRQIQDNVSKRPLLVEQVGERDKKAQLQAMKDLNKLNKIMKDAGVPNPKVYFNQEERDKLDDAEYLEKRGYKEMRSEKI